MLPTSRSVSSVFLAIFRTRGVIYSHSRAVATFERVVCGPIRAFITSNDMDIVITY